MRFSQKNLAKTCTQIIYILATFILSNLFKVFITIIINYATTTKVAVKSPL